MQHPYRKPRTPGSVSTTPKSAQSPRATGLTPTAADLTLETSSVFDFNCTAPDERSLLDGSMSSTGCGGPTLLTTERGSVTFTTPPQSPTPIIEGLGTIEPCGTLQPPAADCPSRPIAMEEAQILTEVMTEVAELQTPSPLSRRRSSAHRMAQLLSSCRDKQQVLDFLRYSSPLKGLLELAEQAQAESDALTTQIVLSALVNLLAIVNFSEIVRPGDDALPRFLVHAFNAQDSTTRAYATAAAYNLTSDGDVLASLSAAGADDILQDLCSTETGESARHANEVLRSIKRRHQQQERSSRPNSASTMLRRLRPRRAQVATLGRYST